jgi:hypothetical protein
MFQNRLGIAQDKGQVDFVSMYDDGIVPTNKGLRTTEELEREAYMTNDIRTAALWSMVQDLETALDVASRLDE